MNSPPDRRGIGQTLAGIAGIAVIAFSLLWLTIFSVCLWTFPWGADSSNTPEVSVKASYLADGKSRLGLTTSDGQLSRHRCDPFAALCRHVMAHSPVVLEIRWAGPSAGMSDSAVLSARAGDLILVNDREGHENLVSLRNSYLQGIASFAVGLLMGGMLLRSRSSAKRGPLPLSRDSQGQSPQPSSRP